MTSTAPFITFRAKPAVYATRDIASALEQDADEPVSAVHSNVFAVTRLADAHLDRAVAIFRQGLGEGFVTRDDLATYVSKHGKAAFVAVSGDQVIGVVTADDINARDHLPADAEPRITALTRRKGGEWLDAAGLLRSVAVSPTARDRGVGSALVTTAVKALGNRPVLSVGWVDYTGCHVQRTLEAARFHSIGDLRDFWTADSKQNGYTCPACGHPCRCTARIFIRER